MPTYVYRVLDEAGSPTDELVEQTYGSFRDRQDRITLPDGKEAVYDFGATAAGVNTTPASVYPRPLYQLSTTPENARAAAKATGLDYRSDGTLWVNSSSDMRKVLKMPGVGYQDRKSVGA